MPGISPGFIALPCPHAIVHRDDSYFEWGLGVRLAHLFYLSRIASLRPCHRETSCRRILSNELPIVCEHPVAGRRGQILVIRPAPIDQTDDRQLLADLGNAAQAIVTVCRIGSEPVMIPM